MALMAVVPFHEQAMAHWNDEVERANSELMASLEDLRHKADRFITVSALATTMFAIFTPGGHPNGSDRGPRVVPVSDDVLAPATPSPTSEGAKVSNVVSLGPTGDSSAPYPDSDQRGIVRLRVSRFDLSRHPEPAAVPAITSPNNVIATVATPISFVVTTTGSPVPSITNKGVLSKCLTLVDNDDGTATISGTPDKTGVYRTTIRARFGRDAHKYVVTQAFTVTVAGGAPAGGV